MGIVLILLMILDSEIEYSGAAEASLRAGPLACCKQRAGAEVTWHAACCACALVALPRIG
ncbi:hypothetical protein NX80_008700 [Xanthomonas vasicola pv. arecae]|uniref:hypothetical protein n=1 Tax=Xanthomonas vasicola TaxID=56459 RepID=UPI00052DE9FD|nr:hypothetical protein [Xanthomonas vasicola]AZR26554.1 hypothetical protein NX80_008700 [Xanthomonas vasicola pv. arecae]